MICVCGVAIVVLVLEHRNQALLARLASEARTDMLTGLHNRRGFDGDRIARHRRRCASRRR
jgi:GGDEF domain-containing protein